MKLSTFSIAVLALILITGTNAFADSSFKGSCFFVSSGSQPLGNFEVKPDANHDFQTLNFTVLNTDFTARVQLLGLKPDVINVKVSISSPDFTNVAILVNGTPGTKLNSIYNITKGGIRGVIECLGTVEE